MNNVRQSADADGGLSRYKQRRRSRTIAFVTVEARRRSGRHTVHQRLCEASLTNLSDQAAGTTVVLEASLDGAAAHDLALTLTVLRGQALVVDAAGTEHLGAQAAQVLLSAAMQWHADKQAFRIVNASEGYATCCGLLGLPVTMNLGEQGL